MTRPVATFVMGEDGELQPVPPPPPMFDTAAREALEALLFLLGWAGGTLPVYVDGEPAAHWATSSADLDKFVRRLKRWPERQVELGLPQGLPGHTVLWAWVESREQAVRAGRRFKPLPSAVLKMGRSCRRLLLWALDEQVPYVSLVPANKRIAYALHAPQKWAEPEKLRIPVPGTALRVGRKNPSPILVTRLTTDTFTRSGITGRLKDPPPDYMTRLRNGEIKGKS